MRVILDQKLIYKYNITKTAKKNIKAVLALK